MIPALRSRLSSLDVASPFLAYNDWVRFPVGYNEGVAFAPIGKGLLEGRGFILAASSWTVEDLLAYAKAPTSFKESITVAPAVLRPPKKVRKRKREGEKVDGFLKCKPPKV